MLKTTLKFENYGSSGLHYIGHGADFEVPGHTIGTAGISVNVDQDQAATITSEVRTKRPAMVVTSVETFDDGVIPAYMPFQKDNYAGASAPDEDNDVTEGYSVGSVWIDTTANPHEIYRCVDASEGAAIWLNTSLELSEILNADMNLALGKVYKINGVKVVGAPGAHVADASAVVGTATNGGYGFVSADEMNAFISGVNAVKDAANAVVARLEGHGLIASA